MKKAVLFTLILSACDGFPILGPLFNNNDGPQTGSITIVLPRHIPVPIDSIPLDSIIFYKH